MRTNLIIALAMAPLSGFALPSSNAHAQPKVKEIYRFPTPNFLENLVVQSNGTVLFGSLEAGALYSIDPWVKNAEPSVVHQFETLNGVGAITETDPDIFVFVAGKFIPEQLAFENGTAAIYQANLRGSEPTISLITQVPDTTMLNGVVILPWNTNLILFSNSYTGEIYRLNVAEQRIEIIYENDRFKPFKDAAKNRAPLGINGMRIRGDTLYLVNSAKGFYANMKITSDGLPHGKLNIIARQLPFQAGHSYDDFAFDCDGNAYVATRLNEVRKIGLDGTQEIFAGGVPGDDFTISGPTSIRFGRGSPKEEKTIYGTSTGLQHDGKMLGGQIFAVRV